MTKMPEIEREVVVQFYRFYAAQDDAFLRKMRRAFEADRALSEIHGDAGNLAFIAGRLAIIDEVEASLRG